MRRLRGITLIELLIFIVLVTVGLLGALAVFGPAVRASADPLLQKQTMNLAESMLREVLQKGFQNDAADPDNNDATLGCTPNTVPRCQLNSQLDRPNYNDVDDYNTFNQNGVVFLANGAAVPGLGACTQTVTVAPPANWNGVSGKFVTVTANCGAGVVTLVGFRGDY
jgi:MSHA pilin protein MshD